MIEKQKILIVDDSEMNRDLLTDILEDQYDVLEAEDGYKAIDIIQERRDEISLVLLDIMMPGMNGFDVLKHIFLNKWNDSFAVIMISADDSPDNIKHAYEMGAFDYINRPFDAVIVQRRISNTMCLYARQKHLEKIVSEQYEESAKSNQLMIAVLSHIVEFRNGESGSHVMHVNKIAEVLLNQLILHTDRYNLTQSDIALITTAASLHDIGKIAIPEEILNKPGRLTDEEFAIVKQHASIGANMLLDLPMNHQEVPLVRMAIEICRWHHERYDGRGYPDGLAGDEIPIGAQVVALADVYDALTSERCYKEAYSHETAVNMIMNGECGTFNPLILECLGEVSTLLKEETRSDKIYDFDSFSSGSKIDYDGMFSGKRYNFQSRQQKMMEKIYTDSLTGIFNRRYYDEYLKDDEDIQAVVMIDVDDFKQINDSFGHDMGDVVLQDVARTLKSCLRKADSVVRYGGDEFAVFFHSIPKKSFEEKLERMRVLIEELGVEEYPNLHISVSIGGAYGEKNAKDLLKIADSTMYQSKLLKNQVNTYFVEVHTDNKNKGE